MCWGCAVCGRMCRLCINGTQWLASWGCAGCCTPPSSGRPQPAPLCFNVREAQVPCSSTCCPSRPSHTLPHSVGRVCAGRVPCWLRVACASWLTRVACAPARCPGWFTLRCDRAIVHGSAHPGFVGGSFPCLAHHSFPQGASGASAVAHWVLDPLGADDQRPRPPV